MSSHGFSFAGGNILADMGATWFVSYAYYDRIDRKHKNWDFVSTSAVRITKYKSSISYHHAWLTEVLVMNDKKLNTNKIGLNAQQTKTMAKEILDNWK